MLRFDDKKVDVSFIHVSASSAKCKTENNELVTLLKEELKKGARKPLYLLRYE